MYMNKRKQFLSVACVYMGQMIVGYSMGWTAPVIPKLQNPEETPLEEVLTDPEAALVGSIFFVGTTIGPYISGYVSNVLGRKICLFSAGLMTLISLLMLALAKTVAVIYVGRVFGGMGTSVIFIMSLVYVGEVASTNIRGILLTLVGLSGSIGTLLVYSYGPFVSYAATSWLPFSVIAVYMALLYFIPESPVFQVMIGKRDEAVANLKALGRDDDINAILALSSEKEKKNNLSLFTDMYRIKSNRKALFILITLNILQQMSGYFSMIFFATTIFDLSGSSMESHIATIILGVTQLVSSSAAPFFIENVGRRPLLLMSTAVSTVSLTTLGTYFYLYETSHPVADKLTWLSLTSLIVYSLVYSIVNLGIGFLIDKIGRKSCIILSFLPHFVTIFLGIFASEVWFLFAARAFDGIGNCLIITTVPTYVSEIASECRGALGSVFQITCAIGILVIYGIGPFMSYHYLNYVILTITVLIAIPIWFIPETPYFLYSKGRVEETIKVLTYLRGSEALAHEELKEYSRRPKMSKREIFQDKTTLKTLGKVLFLGSFMELIGFNAVMFYMQTVLQSTQTSVKEEIASVVNGFIQLIACCSTILLTDKFGRKPLLVTTLIGIAVGMFGLGVFFKLQEDEYQICGFLNFLPLLSMMLVIFCFSAGIGSLFWTLVAELFDGPARAIGMSSSISIAFLFVFLTTKYFVNITNLIGTPITYWVFSVNCLITCVFIIFFIPETKGKSFAEIQRELEK
ncbi:facilitated trehalose transporter Tret1-like isoform X2 [Trichoplusia ni]|uniref:Facilitated trehalose transporter Tret1-like isoform X2 n=1 Tax=Trichoplusia ni TaxID=7111 RepID=A0A7E5VLN1_TRINI|nr:facilitated trehalose transporter Tret1-like isoform X2 [Trichoplusia ni]